jgi:hypothetical protein
MLINKFLYLYYPNSLKYLRIGPGSIKTKKIHLAYVDIYKLTHFKIIHSQYFLKLIKLYEMMASSNSMLNDLTSIIVDHLYVSQVTQIQTNSIQVSYYRDNISLASSQLNLQDSQIKLTSFCDLLGSSSCNNRIITQKVKNLKKLKFETSSFKIKLSF